MITSMCNSYEHTIVITNRHLVQGDFLKQLEKVTKLQPHALILREKDLTDEAYENLAKKVLNLAHFSLSVQLREQQYHVMSNDYPLFPQFFYRFLYRCIQLKRWYYLWRNQITFPSGRINLNMFNFFFRFK